MTTEKMFITRKQKSEKKYADVLALIKSLKIDREPDFSEMHTQNKKQKNKEAMLMLKQARKKKPIKIKTQEIDPNEYNPKAQYTKLRKEMAEKYGHIKTQRMIVQCLNLDQLLSLQ